MNTLHIHIGHSCIYTYLSLYIYMYIVIYYVYIYCFICHLIYCLCIHQWTCIGQSCRVGIHLALNPQDTDTASIHIASRTVGRSVGCTRTDRRTSDRRTDGWTAATKDRRSDGRTDGRTDRQTEWSDSQTVKQACLLYEYLCVYTY